MTAFKKEKRGGLSKTARKSQSGLEACAKYMSRSRGVKAPRALCKAISRSAGGQKRVSKIAEKSRSRRG